MQRSHLLMRKVLAIRSLAVALIGLSVVAVAFASIGWATPDAPQADAVVEVADFNFSPNTVEIEVGDTVTWTRVNGFHSVTADDGSFEQLVGNNWDTFEHTFTVPNEYFYRCSEHPIMTGKVVVSLPVSTPTPTPTSTTTPTATSTPTSMTTTTPTTTPTSTTTATPTVTPTPTTTISPPSDRKLYLPLVDAE